MGAGRGKDPYQELLRKERNKKARATYQNKKSQKESADLITTLVKLPFEIVLLPVTVAAEVHKENKKAKQKQKTQALRKAQAAKKKR